jgi:multiple sugar transport system substrate-binding protein
MKKSLLSVLSVLLILAFILSACAQTATQPPAADNPTSAPVAEKPTEPAAKPVTNIRVVSFLTYQENATGAESKIVDEFQKAHPEIKVDFQLLPFKDYFTLLKTRIAGGDAPDVAALNMESVQEFASLGAVADLTPFIQKENFDLTAYYENTLKMHQYQGKQVGLPASFSDVVMLYNKDLFDKAGLPYPDGSWDWNKYVETAKALTADTNNDGVIEQFGTARAWWPLYLFWNGTNIVTADYKKCVLTEPAAIEGLQKMVDLTLKDKVAPAQEVECEWRGVDSTVLERGLLTRDSAMTREVGP